jgi:hypothetical protein
MDTLGHELRRAKPVMLTFYDYLKTYPYTVTFYIRDDATDQQCQALIQAICDLSNCILGKYKIGYHEFVIPDYRDRLKEITAYVMGTQKWVVQYHTPNWHHRLHSIPGRNLEASLGARLGSGKWAKKPDLENPRWQNFLGLFKALCVSKDGDTIHGEIELDYSNGNWPPKGWKKKNS